MRILPLFLGLAILAACDNKPSTPTMPTPDKGSSGGGGDGPAMAPKLSSGSELPKGETTFYFGVKETLTNVAFQSKNDLTDILGESHVVQGSATIDFAAGSGKCDLSVPTATLNSGMADRDRAMMGPQWLDAKKFESITFKGEKASITDAPNGWTIDGQFTLKGVTKPLSIRAEVRALSANIGNKQGIGDGPCLKVKTAFKVKLADYGIEIPSTAIATVQPEISVTIDIWGSTIKPQAYVAKQPANDEVVVRAAPKPKVSEEGIEGVKYVFGKKPQLAQMTAVSETDVETVTANTKIVAGILGFDKDKGTGMVRIAVPADSLRTGNDTRDEHLRSANWLDTAKFKTIEFESTKATKKDDKNWTVEGNFTMHGVKKPITVDIVLREIPLEKIQAAHWGETPGLGFASKFKLKLSDYGVKIPEIAAAKVSDELSISIDFVALQKE